MPRFAVARPASAPCASAAKDAGDDLVFVERDVEPIGYEIHGHRLVGANDSHRREDLNSQEIAVGLAEERLKLIGSTGGRTIWKRLAWAIYRGRVIAL